MSELWKYQQSLADSPSSKAQQRRIAERQRFEHKRAMQPLELLITGLQLRKRRLKSHGPGPCEGRTQPRLFNQAMQMSWRKRTNVPSVSK